jgi:bifunctional DNase/RNase
VIEMELVGVRVELPSSAPIVLLRETAAAGRLLPIFIGGTEATAIALALDSVETPRPMTHDLFKSVLDVLAVDQGRGEDILRRARARGRRHTVVGFEPAE